MSVCTFLFAKQQRQQHQVQIFFDVLPRPVVCAVLRQGSDELSSSGAKICRCILLEGGPLPVINEVITPTSRGKVIGGLVGSRFPIVP